MRAASRARRARAPGLRAGGERLAFCGGFDLDDPEVLVEAAAAANLRLDGASRGRG